MHPSAFTYILLQLCLVGILHNTTVASGRCLSIEREALLAFKAGVVDSGNRLSSWEGRDCCKWAGVICDANTSHVAELNLRNTHANWEGDGHEWALRGEFNQSLFALTELTRLDLSYNDFYGSSIPESIGSLRKLRYLNLSWASFTGGIPAQLGNLSELRYLDLYGATDSDTMLAHNLEWLPRLSSLKYLDLSWSNLSNVADWFRSVNMLPSLQVLRMESCGLSSIPVSSIELNFTSLALLDLSSNNFNTSLPKWLGSISSLTYVDLSGCQFWGAIADAIGGLTSPADLAAGTIPRSTANLHKLEALMLGDNQLTGSLIGWLEGLTSLTTLVLTNNFLNSSLPAGIGKLSNLTELYLDGNFFEGIISEVHFENLTRLESLDLTGNSVAMSVGQNWVPPFQLQYIGLCGCQIGPRFPEWLQFQTRIESLDLSLNQIAGVLPDWFWNISSSTIIYLNLAYNQIGGKLPPSLEFSKLNTLSLFSNMFEGPLPAVLPSTLDTLFLYNNSFTGPLPAWRHVMQLWISDNMLEGSIPTSLCKWAVLDSLDLSSNNFSGEIPHCFKESQQTLRVLNLANNNFSGDIPRSIGFLKELQILQLNNNSLTGEIPRSLQSCTNLIFLDLGQNKFYGSIPPWMGERLTSLQVLRLHSNMLSGDIPWQLAQLPDLRVLDLADNNVLGSIPHSFGNFSAMILTSQIPTFLPHLLAGEGLHVSLKGQDRTYRSMRPYLAKSLDLSSNNLSGEIPSEIGALVGLQNLNLSRNQLTGNIPQRLGEMKSLESLDLSVNDFSGNIPEKLSTLTFLSYLNLSYNNLTGRIPLGHQLQTLDNPSIYIGNPGLCGPPVSKNCPGDETIRNGEQKHSKSREMIWILISMMLGLAVGFWSFCGVLILKRSWRHAYFRAVDNFFDLMLMQWEKTIKFLL